MTTPIRNKYFYMRNSCYKEKHHNFRNVGAKGVKVCTLWLNDFKKFEKWSMENGYTDTSVLELKNKKRNFSPSNCRWVEKAIIVDGKAVRLATLAKQMGVSRHVLYFQLKRNNLRTNMKKEDLDVFMKNRKAKKGKTDNMALYRRYYNMRYAHQTTGATMYAPWKKDFMDFKKWAIKNGYKNSMVLYRKDRKKGYSPSNCQWVTKERWNRELRGARLIVNGKPTTATELSRKMNIPYPKLYRYLTTNKLGSKVRNVDLRKMSEALRVKRKAVR